MPETGWLAIKIPHHIEQPSLESRIVEFHASKFLLDPIGKIATTLPLSQPHLRFCAKILLPVVAQRVKEA
jgi:hypothetical protein